MSNIKEWDEYFYNMCVTVEKNSKCLSRKIGSVLVRDNSIISTGYNGPPRGVRPCDERWLIDNKLRERAGFTMDIKSSEFRNIYLTKLRGKCPRYISEMGFKSGQGLEWCVASHSEVSTLINAARNGIGTKDTKLFMTCGIPCSKCLSTIINAGVEEIIVTKITYYDESSEYLLKDSGLKFRLFSHIKEDVVGGIY